MLLLVLKYRGIYKKIGSSKWIDINLSFKSLLPIFSSLSHSLSLSLPPSFPPPLSLNLLFSIKAASENGKMQRKASFEYFCRAKTSLTSSLQFGSTKMRTHPQVHWPKFLSLISHFGVINWLFGLSHSRMFTLLNRI